MLYYNKQTVKKGCSSLDKREVIAMTALEVFALLDLLATIIFGILGYIKK